MTPRKWKPVEWQIGRDENAQGPFRPRPIALPDSAVSGDPGIETWDRLAFRFGRGFAWSFAFQMEAPPRLDEHLNEIPDLSPTDPRRDQMGRPLQRPLSGPLPAGTPLKLGGSDARGKTFLGEE
jgi:hypothetical protein